jgi:hypothetical protein
VVGSSQPLVIPPPGDLIPIWPALR